MVSDGTELIDKVCGADGFTRREDGGATILINVENGDEIRVKETAKNGYMITKLGSQEPPITFGAQLGNGAKRTNVEARLARWGIEVRRDRLQRQARQARRQAADEASASGQPPETTPTTANPTTPEVDDMTKAANDILSDIPYSMDVIAAAVIDLAKAANATPILERGVTVYDWSGDLYDVLRSLWPELPVEPVAEDLKRLYVELIPKMRHSGVLRKQLNAYKGGRDVWRVRDDGRRAMAEPVAAAPPPKEAAMSVATPAPAPVINPEEHPEPVKLYPCPELNCAFVDPNEHATQAHISKFKNRPKDHPVGKPGMPCPEGCGAVRTEPYAVRKHAVRDHPDKYKPTDVMCQKLSCFEWFASTGEYRTHLTQEHPEAMRRTREKVGGEVFPLEEFSAPPGATVAPTAPKPVKAKMVAVPAPVAVVNGAASSPDGETPAEAAIRMLTEYPVMKERLNYLEVRNETLEHELKEKDRALRSFKKKLDALFSE